MTDRRQLAVALCGLALVTGCATTDRGKDAPSGPFGQISNPLDWGADPDEPREGTPERVVATWVDTVRNTPGEPSERGFGGRLYFYDRGADPITVDGRLVVYTFDEEGRNPTDHQPTKRFVFPAEQVAKHMSVSEIGPSYSVWLPWGEADGPPTRVSLIARFEPSRGGGLVVSDQATQLLPGRGLRTPDTGDRMLAQRNADGVRQATFAEASAKPAPAATPSNVEPRKRLSTTTIRLRR